MSPEAPTEILADLVSAMPTALFVSTCGYLSRDLQQVGDRPSFFYLVGSMGAALPMGLALAECTPETRVVVIDGDGSFLMSLNCLPMIDPETHGNLVHVVLDNGMHESTGGQRTVATGVRIPQAMRAGGYRRVLGADSVTGFALAALKEPGPTGIHIPIAPRVSIAPRIGTEPDELVRRTRNLLVHNARRQR